MSLFDFFRKKAKATADESGPSPHYVFAHYALRTVAISSPLEFLAACASPESEKFPSSILRSVEDQCNRKACFDASSIKVHQSRVGDFPCAILEMPEPSEMAQAYMIAFVVLVNRESGISADMNSVDSKCFTLEKSASLSGEPCTVLGGWDESMHSNYGSGPAPNVTDFSLALNELMS